MIHERHQILTALQTTTMAMHVEVTLQYYVNAKLPLAATHGALDLLVDAYKNCLSVAALDAFLARLAREPAPSPAHKQARDLLPWKKYRAYMSSLSKSTQGSAKQLRSGIDEHQRRDEVAHVVIHAVAGAAAMGLMVAGVVWLTWALVQEGSQVLHVIDSAKDTSFGVMAWIGRALWVALKVVAAVLFWMAICRCAFEGR